ncbi:MAG: class I SAM-dependent methyltransferase [Thermoguttaceae bacterium]|jgi:23S rRNA (cytosine1962-C5)-methyltransferase
MLISNDYQLLDFGNGRRLERIGEITLDRPCPTAEHLTQADSGAWQTADARFETIDEQEGRWICRRELPDHWTVAHGNLRFELKRTPFGHIGLFPEQAENWDWIGDRMQGSGFRVQDSAATNESLATTGRLALHGRGVLMGRQLKILNLFAYTGASTLAAAAAGAEVTHVDAAKNIVDWARRNAELSGLADAPIHWITEDAMKFVKREIKRGNKYDAVILDPPSYGHGRRGEVWRLSKQLPRLLSMCAELTAGQCRFVLLTCHTPGYDSARLADMLRETIPDAQSGVMAAKTMTLRSVAGRELPSGSAVRWTADSK